MENRWWSEGLPLAPAQAAAIKKLDALIREAADQAALSAADYLDTHPPDAQDLLIRLNQRLLQTLAHGERMAAAGLLTDPQAAWVTQRYLSSNGHLHVLYDENVQQLLGITADQRKQLATVAEEANQREGLLNLWTVKPAEQEYVRTVMEANEKRMNQEALDVLTPAQHELWARLTAPRTLPATPPDLAAPSEAEASRIRITDASPVFRILADKADVIQLSTQQKKLLKSLEEVTQEGLYWISLRDAGLKDEAAARSAFVGQAEQIVLTGILTENQVTELGSGSNSSPHTGTAAAANGLEFSRTPVELATTFLSEFRGLHAKMTRNASLRSDSQDGDLMRFRRIDS